MNSSSRLRILVSGMVAGDPGLGGASWAVLQYVLGFQSLGHEVYLVEPIDDSSIHPRESPLDRSDNATYFRCLVDRFGLAERASLLHQQSKQAIGVPYDRLCRVARDVDVLINISGMLSDPRLIERLPTRVYLDLDPAFNQLW